jgi:hypothetical protein
MHLMLHRPARSAAPLLLLLLLLLVTSSHCMLLCVCHKLLEDVDG